MLVFADKKRAVVSTQREPAVQCPATQHSGHALRTGGARTLKKVRLLKQLKKCFTAAAEKAAAEKGNYPYPSKKSGIIIFSAQELLIIFLPLNLTNNY